MLKAARKNYHWLILAVFVLLSLIFNHFVYMSFDDFQYSLVLKFSDTPQHFFDFHVHHYMYQNGRALIHFIVTLLAFQGGQALWRLYNPFLLALLMVLIAKSFTKTTHDFKRALAVCCVVFTGIGGALAIHAPYQMVTSFNYTYPALLLFANICLINKANLAWDYAQKPLKKWAFRIAVVLMGLLIGASMEQYALMAIGYIVLYILFKCIPYFGETKTKLSFFEGLKATLKGLLKIRKLIYISLLLNIGGFLTVFLAPGNFHRMVVHRDVSKFTNFVAATTVFLNTKSTIVYTFILLCCLCAWMFSIKFKNRYALWFHRLWAVCLILGWCFNAFLTLNTLGINNRSHIIIRLLFQGSDLAFLAALVYIPILLLLKYKRTVYIVSAILALGSLYMLVFAAVAEYRILMPCLYGLFPFIYLTAAEFVKKPIFKPLAAVICVLTLGMYSFTLHGLYKNYKVNEINMQRVAEYKRNPPADKVLVFLPTADDETQGFSINRIDGAYASLDGHRGYFLTLNDIPDAKLYYEDKNGELIEMEIEQPRKENY
ncbi:MAG: DUF6056 family protein [Oscillospiraceae bacterium]|jgi:hypothetical protein|nr:DUF6056 family protein [Oscillospiraceae bacterium]